MNIKPIRIERNLIKIGDTFYSDFAHRGVRYRRALSKFVNEARQLRNDLIRSIRGSKPGEDASMSWALFKEKFLKYHESQSANTQYRNKQAFRLVDAYRPIRLLSQFTPELLLDLQKQWTDHSHAGKGHTWGQVGKIAPSTITRSIKALKKAMRWAEDMKFVPVQNWRVIKVEEAGGRLIYHDLDGFKRLLKVCAPPWQMSAMLQGRLGLRGGEVYNLEWTDINFEQGFVRIHSRPGGWRIKGDRKGNKEKFIPLVDKDLYDYLWKRRKGTGFVIDVRGYGERMTHNWFLRKMTGYMRKAKLEGKPHDLRHTCASMMVNNGAPLEAVSALLDHKNLKTSQIYTHLNEEAKRRALGYLPPLSK